MTFPDGSVVEGDVVLDEPVQTEIYNRLAIGHVVGGPWAAALEPFAHRRVLLVRCDKPGGTRIRAGETQVRNAVSLVSDGSLRELAAKLGVDEVDGRRFRMLIEVEGAAAHEEDTWIGRDVAIGSAVLQITKPDARCAITTQDPDTGERDLDTLRTILRYRGFRADDPERKIDFGVLGEVRQPGRISVGDEVAVLEQAGSTTGRRRGRRSDVADLIDALAGLRPEERERLERFALAFERLDASGYMMFADIPDQEVIDRAQAAAIDRVGSGRAARCGSGGRSDAFVDAATVAYSRRFSLPDTFLLFQSLPGPRRGSRPLSRVGGACRRRADPVGRARRGRPRRRSSDRGPGSSSGERLAALAHPPRRAVLGQQVEERLRRRTPPARGRRSPARSRARAAPARRPG